MSMLSAGRQRETGRRLRVAALAWRAGVRQGQAGGGDQGIR
jgi:hypothetical protein